VSVRERRRGATRAPTLDDARALIAVEAFARKFGQGPTWRELGRLLGWPEAEAADRVRELLAVGLRYRRDEPRSLNVTESGLERALRVARGQKEARP
jgi:hypothetical protein